MVTPLDINSCFINLVSTTCSIISVDSTYVLFSIDLTSFCVSGASLDACSAEFEIQLIIADLPNNPDSIVNEKIKDQRIMVFVFEDDVCSAQF